VDPHCYAFPDPEKSHQWINRQLYLLVLGVPFVRIRNIFEPLLILWNSEEILDLLTLPDLERNLFDTRTVITNKHDTYPDNMCDKLNQENGDLQQRWVKVVQEVPS
jgi:hypothetical protein